MRFAALAGVLMLIGACASELGVFKMYQGPKQPDSNVARIYVPGDIGVVAVDEKSVFTLLWGDVVELQVLPGAHKITLRYYRIFKRREDLIKVTSDPVTKSLTVRAGQSYRIEHDSPETLESAEAYAQNFDYRIREIGTAPGSRAGVILAGEAVQRSTAAVVSEVPAQPAADATGTASARAPLEHLKYWWGQASDVDRRDFRRWIQSP